MRTRRSHGCCGRRWRSRRPLSTTRFPRARIPRRWATTAEACQAAPRRPPSRTPPNPRLGASAAATTSSSSDPPHRDARSTVAGGSIPSPVPGRTSPRPRTRLRARQRLQGSSNKDNDGWCASFGEQYTDSAPRVRTTRINTHPVIRGAMSLPDHQQDRILRLEEAIGFTQHDLDQLLEHVKELERQLLDQSHRLRNLERRVADTPPNLGLDTEAG